MPMARRQNANAPVYEDFQPTYEWADEKDVNVLYIHVPGFTGEQLKIMYGHTSRVIRVLGEKSLGNNRWSRFNQSFPVPENCEVTKIHAKFQHGILTITLPKSVIPPPPPEPKVKATPQETQKAPEAPRAPPGRPMVAETPPSAPRKEVKPTPQELPKAPEAPDVPPRPKVAEAPPSAPSKEVKPTPQEPARAPPTAKIPEAPKQDVRPTPQEAAKVPAKAHVENKASLIEGLEFEQEHGKQRVRVARVWRNTKSGQHEFVEWSVGISLFSHCIESYTHDDNSDIVATDTMKNTVYVKAKECDEQLSVEEFAIVLGRHFTSLYAQVTAAIVKIVEKPWERVSVDGQPHTHGFKLGSEKHTVEAIVKKDGFLQLTSGIEGLALLKTTKSGFEGFVHDKYTALPDTRERMLATEVTASWRYSFGHIYSIPKKSFYFSEQYMGVKKVMMDTFYGPPKDGVYSPSVQSTLYQMAKAVLSRFPDVLSVQLKMPNIHFLPVNITNRDKKTIVKFDNDVYLPTDEPHGSIQASLSRPRSKL